MNYIGLEIEIITMFGEPQYKGKRGIVESVDDIGQLHGTWGGLAINPSVDLFRIVGENE